MKQGRLAVNDVKLNDPFLAPLECEADRSRRALEQVPDGKYDWKPHERSMIFGYLAELVATTIGVSLQDRSAILPVGRSADGAFWYDSGTGEFVTST